MSELLYDRDVITIVIPTVECIKAALKMKVVYLQLDPVSRVTGIPGWYWILGIKCSDTTGVELVY